MELERVINIVYERALEVIDDSLYELLDDSDSDEFYMDYKEAFISVVDSLNRFHNGE